MMQEVWLPTYKQIQDHVRATRSFAPKTCWIADLLAEHQPPNAWRQTGATRYAHASVLVKREELKAAMQGSVAVTSSAVAFAGRALS